MRSALPPLIHEAPSIFIPFFLALSLASCSRSTSVTCSSGVACPSERSCSGDGTECIETLCGDGIRQENESCDDGNTREGDGCNHTCASDETCGNGTLDPGELCDDGNNLSGDRCSPDCTSLAQCGNGVVDLDEECDDKNDSDEDDCLSTCRLATCGDGKWNRLGYHHEECDSAGETDACNLNCTVARCSDGVVNSKAGEQCDPPGSRSPDGALCNQFCRVAFCGNRTPDEFTDEQCDDGNTSNEDSCLNTCHANVCGDGHRDPSREACDDGNTTTEVACPYGSKTCTACNADCTAALSLSGPYCGDGFKNGGEECDHGQACGTCTAQCGRILAAPAEGSIVVLSFDDLAQGDTLAISDGSHLPVVFELWATCSTYDGHHRCISMAQLPLPSAMADAIADAIQRAIDDGLLDMAVDHQGNRVRLTNEQEGPAGNQLIIKDSVGLFVSGMSDGRGYDCVQGDRCSTNEDCVRPLECTDSQAGPFKTCQ